MQTLSFICVNFNNSKCTEKLCQSLSAQLGLGDQFQVQCLVVDNSTDQRDSVAAEAICRRFSWARYIKSASNLGYFGGIKRGLDERPQDQSRFVVVGNNDIEFDASFCSRLLNLPEDSRAFAICPDVITKEGVHQNPHVADKVSLLQRLRLDLYFSHFYIARVLLAIKRLSIHSGLIKRPIPCKERREIYMGIGACYVLTRNFFASCEELHCPVFLYGEEAFLSAQIHSHGGALFYEPSLLVRHAESATLSQVPRRVAYEYARSSYPLYRKLLYKQLPVSGKR